MYENILLTSQPLMDFVLNHILSIILFSENGIMLKQNIEHKNKDHDINPIIGLYPKGLPIQTSDFSWQKYASQQSPCYITTGYSIQLLAKAASFISEHPEIFKSHSLASAIQAKLINISNLQLDYCLENIQNSNHSIEAYVSILEGCLAVARLEDKPNHSLYNTIDMIYSKLSGISIVNYANTLELSKIINGLHYMIHSIPSHPTAEETICSIALELVERRNYLGLFQRDRFNRRTAPLSWQFYCIASLLLAYSICPIDKIIEEAFSAFNQLYQLSWNSYLDLFSFSRKLRIRHTPLEIASIVKALNLLLSWVSSEEQYERLYQILHNSYFPILSKEFFINYYKSISVLYNNFLDRFKFSSRLKTIKHTGRTLTAPVFPSAIQITSAQSFSSSLYNSKKLKIQWLSGSPIHIRYPLELCIQLIDYLESNYENKNQQHGEDQSLDLINLLFSILRQNN